MGQGISGQPPTNRDEDDGLDQALRQSKTRFRAFIDASTDAIFQMNADWTEMRQLHGRGFVVDAARPRRNWADDYIPADEQKRVLESVRESIRTGKTFELEHRIRRRDGSVGWALSRAVAVRDENGEVVEWLGTTSDITARRRAIDDLARVTAEAHAQKRLYESIISSTPDLVYAFDRNYRFIFANRALLEMWGRTLEDSLGKGLIELGYEPWHAEMHEREIDQVAATRMPIRGEVGFPHATLGWRIYDYIFTPVFNEAGEVESIAGTTRDITEIKRAEEHLKLLVNELNHRVKNTLATVQSIAFQTFRGHAAEAGARTAFEARLMALSEAHTVLTRANWQSANLDEIAAGALAPFRNDAGEAGRITVEGARVQLRPQTTLALSMALHELASNATKYGALSGPDGHVRLRWTCEGGRLQITWLEAGGPPVTAPKRRGFGSRLIEGMARELNGTVRLDYQPSGLVCTIDFPIPSPPESDHGPR
jgi:PAS domain S-box-containing protein